MVEWVKWLVMDCMGERISDGGIIALVSHGDIMGLIFFYVCNRGKEFFMDGKAKMVCHG